MEFPGVPVDRVLSWFASFMGISWDGDPSRIRVNLKTATQLHRVSATEGTKVHDANPVRFFIALSANGMADGALQQLIVRNVGDSPGCHIRPISIAARS
jgi:hypothetical protein